MTRFRRQDIYVILIGLLLAILAHVLFIDWHTLIACKEDRGILSPLPGVDRLAALYESKLRSDFFSGFLAVGAFLLSLKTFIVMTMKTNVYDTKEYRALWEENSKRDAKITGPRYRGLQELNDCMFNSIFCTLSAAIAQVTIGIAGGPVFTFVSLLLCTTSICYLIYCLLLVKENLNSFVTRE